MSYDYDYDNKQSNTQIIENPSEHKKSETIAALCELVRSLMRDVSYLEDRVGKLERELGK